ncbi:hypothetical protein QUF64_07045 [Anaerolineales bacterium HSG6]|nr:hypothetical protein [Anaerolineales bacterium HSG6]
MLNSEKSLVEIALEYARPEEKDAWKEKLKNEDWPSNKEELRDILLKTAGISEKIVNDRELVKHLFDYRQRHVRSVQQGLSIFGRLKDDDDEPLD